MSPKTLLAFACLAGLVSAPAAFAQSTSGRAVPGTPAPIVLMPPAPPSPNAAPAGGWMNAGQARFGPAYELYVPVEIKSNNPDVERSANPAGVPLNGTGLAPIGDACTTDADCTRPLGCFNRADSGQVPVRLCAVAPAH